MKPPASGSPHAIGLTTFRGLPAHILIVHLVVVFVPLAAIALIAALRPAWARRMGLVLPGLSIVAFLSVLAAMNAGGWLQNHVQNTALVRDHTRIAGQLWPFSAVVALLSLVVWWRNGRSSTNTAADSAPATSTRSGTGTLVLISVITILVSVGSVIQVVRIGESGSRAAWQNHYSRASSHSGS